MNPIEYSKKIFQTLTTPKQQTKPPTEEMSRSGMDVWGMSQPIKYNPDDLVGRKGLGIYKKMQQRDGQVKAVFMMKKFARLSTPWSIRPYDEDDSDAVRQAEFIEYCFDDMRGSIDDFLLKMWNAMRDGYSVAEMNYKMISGGDFSGMVGLDSLKVRDASTFQFECDEHGNIKEDGLIQGFNTRLPVNKFVVFSYNPNNDDSESIYGESDFRAAYRYYFSNDLIQRFWNIYLEKFGQPTVVGKYPTGTTKQKQDELFNILKNIQTDTVVTIPENLIIDLLEATRNSQAGYKDAMEYNNNMIARSLLVGSLLMDTGDKGSWALSKTHFDIFIYILDYLGKETEETIMKEQVIRRLIDYNFANPKYPSFEFESMIKDDQEAKARVIKLLVNGGIVNPGEEWVREYLSIPAKEKDVQLPEPKPDNEPIYNQYQAKRQLTKFEKKVNFTRIEKSLNKYETGARDALVEIITKQKEALGKSIIRSKLIENNEPKEIEKLQLNYVGELRTEIKNWLIELWKYGKEEVRSELSRMNFVDVVIGLPPEKAMKYLQNKAFYIAGVIRDDILKKARTILYNGLRSGKKQSELIYELDNYFKEYIGTPGIEIKSGRELTPYHLENVVRTNLSDAYNQGRLDMMRDPDVKGFVVAYQYSAIMDDRTTDFCASMDGKVFEANDPDIARINPPNHYQCRSQLIPITKYEKFEPIDAGDKARILATKTSDFIFDREKVTIDAV